MKFRNDLNLHPAMFNALTRNDYDYEHAGDFSATALIKSPRQVQLEKRYDKFVEKDASTFFPSVMGSSIHYMIQREADKMPDCIVEKRIAIDIDGLKITCKPDMIQIIEKGVVDVYDWKNTGVYGVILAEGGVKTEWEQQLNINSAIIRHAWGWKTRALVVGCLFRDWKKGELHKAIIDNKNYPEGYGQMIEIPLWDEKKQDEFLFERVSLHREYKNAVDDKLPECTAEERWDRGECWAIMKPGRKTALKLCSSEDEAKGLVGADKTLTVVHRPGRSMKCESYCNGAPWCDFYLKAFNRELPAKGEIVSI